MKIFAIKVMAKLVSWPVSLAKWKHASSHLEALCVMAISVFLYISIMCISTLNINTPEIDKGQQKGGGTKSGGSHTDWTKLVAGDSPFRPLVLVIYGGTGQRERYRNPPPLERKPKVTPKSQKPLWSKHASFPDWQNRLIRCCREQPQSMESPLGGALPYVSTLKSEYLAVGVHGRVSCPRLIWKASV